MIGSRPRALLAFGAALALTAVAAWCGLSRVDDRFARTHHSLDLDHPERWACDPIAVAPGTLGRLLWARGPSRGCKGASILTPTLRVADATTAPVSEV